MVYDKKSYKGLLIHIWELASVLTRGSHVFSAEVLFGKHRLNQASFAAGEHPTPQEAEQEAIEFIDSLHTALTVPNEQDTSPFPLAKDDNV